LFSSVVRYLFRYFVLSFLLYFCSSFVMSCFRPSLIYVLFLYLCLPFFLLSLFISLIISGFIEFVRYLYMFISLVIVVVRSVCVRYVVLSFVVLAFSIRYICP